MIESRMKGALIHEWKAEVLAEKRKEDNRDFRLKLASDPAENILGLLGERLRDPNFLIIWVNRVEPFLLQLFLGVLDRDFSTVFEQEATGGFGGDSTAVVLTERFETDFRAKSDNFRSVARRVGRRFSLGCSN